MLPLQLLTAPQLYLLKSTSSYYCHTKAFKDSKNISGKLSTDFSPHQQESPVPIVTSIHSEPYVDRVSSTASADNLDTSEVKLLSRLKVSSMSTKKPLRSQCDVVFECIDFKR